MVRFLFWTSPHSRAERRQRQARQVLCAMLDIRDNTALSRLELESGGVTAFLNYRLDGGLITLQHTETPVAARGRGLASQLVQGVLDIVRARGTENRAVLRLRARLPRQTPGISGSGSVASDIAVSGE